MKRSFLFIVLFNIFLLSISQEIDLKPKSQGEFIKHEHYCLSYSEEHEQAEWVFYLITPDMLNGHTERTNDFREDKTILTGSSSLDDYRGSGYDRGHLCPAHDMSFSKEAMSESFFLSNMSPQNTGFNRGGWKKLESLFRCWAKDSDISFIVTGPVFNGSSEKIGENNVTVPSAYYKIIYIPSDDKMIGFLMPNKPLTRKLVDYACSVNYIEAITSIDFFEQLENQKEEELENQANAKDWYFFKELDSNQEEIKKQCKGFTKSGNRCKRKVKGSYCYQHQGN